MNRIVSWFLNSRYEVIAMLNGAIIMVLEIVGARIIAPQFGSSIYVWTAVIGVILAALSAGYWYGGKLADRGVSDRGLGGVLTLAAAVLLVSHMGREFTLSLVAGVGSEVRIQALLAAIVLFAPANFLMGMVSPYVARLSIVDMATAGSSVGRLYAAGTVGSIIGTFAAGYWLIALLGSRALGLWLVLGLVVTSFVAQVRQWVWWRLGLVVVTLALLVGPVFERVGAYDLGLVYDGDSAYARWQVLDVSWAGRPARLLMNDREAAQSGIYLDNPGEPLFDYIDDFLKIAESVGDARRVLVIGGGTYTFPQLLTERYPEMQVDVVEMDSKLDVLAARFFDFTPHERIRIIHEDGRVFLNQNKAAYDLIFIDAFSSKTPPFHLTTREAVSRVADSLTSRGLVVVNMISAQWGDKAAFGEAEYATYRHFFDNVCVVTAGLPVDPEQEQNLVLAAGMDSAQIEAARKKLDGKDVELSLTQGILTDDFAPVEQMIAL